jgi:hypothetical protein
MVVVKARGPKDDFIQLRHIAAELPTGTTDNKAVCPFCRGGANGDNGFSITRISESEAAYCCHRASCGRAGRIAVWGFRLESTKSDNSTDIRKKEFTPRLYTGATGQLDSEWNSEILDRYGLQSDESDWAGWCMDLETKRLVCPIFSPTGMVRGFETRISKLQRSLVELAKKSPKTSHYRQVEGVWVAWYRRIKAGAVLVVEDVISALKASRHIQACALMGSHMDEDSLLEIIQVAAEEPIFLALDKDATHKAEKFIQKYRFVAPNLRFCPLSKDLKYLSDQEIESLIC